MTASLALALLATVSGTLATYLYDDGASFAARVCSGACIGQASLGLIGFILASFLGLTPLAIAAMVVILILPCLALTNATHKGNLQADLKTVLITIKRTLLRPSRKSLGYSIFYAIVAVVLWKVFSRAVIETPEGVYTGVLNNFGDLPFHLSVISSFAYGQNFPPEDPTFAGVRFTYPFLSDFVSAVYVRCGADLRESMLIENFILSISFVGLLHRWALELVRDHVAAALTPLLVLLSGGLGWVLLWQQAGQDEQGLFGILKNLPPSFTVIPETTWRWGNAISALLVPQRGILLGLPLAVIVFTQWWLAGDPGQDDQEEKVKGKKYKGPKGNKQAAAPSQNLALLPFYPLTPAVSRMIAAGVVAGVLPLVHAHSFVVVMAVGGFIALGLHWRAWLAVGASLIPIKIILDAINAGNLPAITGHTLLLVMAILLTAVLFFLLPRTDRVLWYAFFLTALAIALPQLWWSTRQSAVDSSTFFAWQFGWDRGNENALWFWFKNTGLFIPLTIAALTWRGKDYLIPRRLLRYYLPFTLCFVIPNMVRMAPWIWDNIKVLFYWWLASAPLVALLLARLWHQGSWRRSAAVILFFSVILAGSLDVAAITLRSVMYQVFDRKGIEFAEVIKEETQPRSLIVHAPVHNHPVFLTGRRSLMGYPGHIWTHGLDFVQRESEIKRIYSGSPEAPGLMQKYGIEYAVVGPLERRVMNVNDQFFSRFQKVGEVGEYRLYKIAQK